MFIEVDASWCAQVPIHSTSLFGPTIASRASRAFGTVVNSVPDLISNSNTASAGRWGFAPFRGCVIRKHLVAGGGSDALSPQNGARIAACRNKGTLMYFMVQASELMCLARSAEAVISDLC